jgi:tetratricopeptide (TPR) repeat protein
MATQPIPKVDMEALEAAARGEGVSPDAETIDAQAADIEAQLEEVSVESEGDTEGEVAPDDITIEAHAGDLQAEFEQEAEPVEAVSGFIERDSEEEIPDWLIAAAEQAEPPAEAPSGLPAEFVKEADEIEVEPEPSTSEEFEAALPPESDIDEVQISETSKEDTEVEWFDAGEAGDIEAEPVTEPSEARAADEFIEAEQPEADLITADEVEQSSVSEITEFEAAEEAEPVVKDSPDTETKKKEDLLERSRQALASGDIQSATEMYGDLVKRKESLESVIEDLRIAVDRTPDNADLWQVLGDAYMRDDQTDEAIDAYRKGMEAA